MNSSMQFIRFASLIRSGLTVEQAIDNLGGIPDQKNIRFLIELAQETGSAIGAEIIQIAEQFAEFESAERRIQVLQSAPRASARLIIWLPVALLALAQVSGFPIIEAILGQSFLQLSVGLGLVLLISAKFLSDRMISTAARAESSTGLYLLAVAMNLGSSGSLQRAAGLASQRYEQVFGRAPEPGEQATLMEIAELTEKNGNPSSEIIRKQADLLQRVEFLDLSQKIEKLSVKLLLPLGLLVLPAFVLIALVPLSFLMLGY